MSLNQRQRSAGIQNFRRRSIKKKKTPVEWIARFTGLAGVVTIGLLLLGFGVAMSAESWGQVPYGSIYTSPTELISLSVVAISTLIAHIEISHAFWQFVLAWLPYGALFGSVVGFFVLLSTWPNRVLINRCQNTHRRSMEWIRNRVRHTTRLKALFNGILAFLLSIMLVPLAAIFYLWMMIAALCILCFLPIIGFSAGKTYIKEYVINPDYCYENRPDEKTKVANCLLVKHKDLGEYRGRLVYSTSSVIVLYRKESSISGKFVRIPIADSIIEAIVSKGK